MQWAAKIVFGPGIGVEKSCTRPKNFIKDLGYHYTRDNTIRNASRPSDDGLTISSNVSFRIGYLNV